MKRIWFLVLSLSILLSSTSFAGAEELTPGEEFHRAEWAGHMQRMARQLTSANKIPFHLPVYDVHHYQIDVTLDPTDSSMVGVVGVYASSLVDTLSEITLDLVQTLTVDSVSGNATAFTHADSLITLTLDRTYTTGETFMVLVEYGGFPRDHKGQGINFRRHGDDPLIFTLVEPFFASYWWPCKDVPWDKADSSQVTIRVPDYMTGVSNGVLIGVDSISTPGWKAYQWITRHPIPPYLISVAATNYVLLEDEYVSIDGNTVPITNYVYPEDALFGESTFAMLKPMMANQESLFGPYPFSDEKYGHAVVRGGGAMEHNTVTSWGHILVAPNRGFDDIVLHELAHQWWGDKVTCADWPDLWLNEGFATYSEGLWREERYGEQGLSLYMNSIAPAALGANLSPYIHRVPDFDTLFTTPYFRAVYSGGAWVLHQLRGTLGDSLFFAALDKHQADGFARGGFATTEEFRAACESVSGLDLEYFWDQWIYSYFKPAFLVDPFISASGDSSWVRLRQDSDTAYVAPVDIRFSMADGGDTTITVWTGDTGVDQYEFVLNGEATDIAFDPDHWLLDWGFYPFAVGSPDSVLVLDDDDGVMLHWEVTNEFADGVNIYRAQSEEGPWEKINETPLLLTGDYDAGSPSAYRFFHLRMMSDSLPGYESIPSNAVETSTPTEYALLVGDESFQGSANPYLLDSSEPYQVRFNLPRSGVVRIDIYSIAGRLVRCLHDADVSAGFSKVVEWDGKNDAGDEVAPGIYLLRLEAGTFEATRKFVVLQ